MSASTRIGASNAGAPSRCGDLVIVDPFVVAVTSTTAGSTRRRQARATTFPRCGRPCVGGTPGWTGPSGDQGRMGRSRSPNPALLDLLQRPSAPAHPLLDQ